MTDKLQLRDVTVCVADSVAPLLAARALEICLDRCDFGDAILFSDTAVVGRFRNVKVDALKSFADYSRFCLSSMADHIDTPFALVVQWDGYVVNAGAWANAFRKYDYIGAPIHKNGVSFVGNGGFSLRSRKLLKALPRLPVIDRNEDLVICETFRKTLEQDFGIRFAPEKVAARFSYEDVNLGGATFGFHGAPNLWRHESDNEVVRICQGMPAKWLESFFFFGLVMSCLKHCRPKLAGSLYSLVRANYPPDAVKRLMIARGFPENSAERTVGSLEVGRGDH